MTTKATQPTKAKCRSCGAAIYWGRMSSSGKAIPLDVEPQKEGNLWCSQRQTSTGIELVVVPAQAVDDPRLDSFNRDRRRWQSHFASCPNASEHRGDKAEKTPPKDGLYVTGSGVRAFINFAPRGRKR